MNINECIKTRRSIRKYLDKKIPDELIEKLIDAARYAPFGGPPKPECQVWEFIIIRDKKTIKKLALSYEDRQFLLHAQVIIAVCADKNKDPEYRDWDITASLAIENILITAHSLGLGACSVSTFTHHDGHKEDRKILVEALDLPANIELITLIPIGYPDPSEKLEEKKLRSLKEIIHHEKW